MVYLKSEKTPVSGVVLGTPNVENLEVGVTKGKRLFLLITTIQKIIEAYVLIQWTLGADL